MLQERNTGTEWNPVCDNSRGDFGISWVSFFILYNIIYYFVTLRHAVATSAEIWERNERGGTEPNTFITKQTQGWEYKTREKFV